MTLKSLTEFWPLLQLWLLLAWRSWFPRKEVYGWHHKVSTGLEDETAVWPRTVAGMIGPTTERKLVADQRCGQGRLSLEPSHPLSFSLPLFCSSSSFVLFFKKNCLNSLHLFTVGCLPQQTRGQQRMVYWGLFSFCNVGPGV